MSKKCELCTRSVKVCPRIITGQCGFLIFLGQIQHDPVSVRLSVGQSLCSYGLCEEQVLDRPASEDKGPYALTPNTVELIAGLRVIADCGLPDDEMLEVVIAL